MRTVASVMFFQAFRQFTRDAGVVLLDISFADENVNIDKTSHLLACQAVVLERLTSNAIQDGPPSFHSGAADLRFTLALPAKVWSLGDSNP